MRLETLRCNSTIILYAGETRQGNRERSAEIQITALTPAREFREESGILQYKQRELTYQYQNQKTKQKHVIPQL